MIHKASKLALVAAVALCLPAAAQAGTSTTTSTANFQVLNQCSITGATLDLGTFTTQNTWGDVAAATGRVDTSLNLTQGSRGLSYLNMGTLTCDLNTLYDVNITGSSTGSGYSNGAVKLAIGGKTGKFLLFVNKIGNMVVTDEAPTAPGAGTSIGWWGLGYFNASGVPQPIVGSAALITGLGEPGEAQLTDKLNVAGSYSDTLTYTLNF